MAVIRVFELLPNSGSLCGSRKRTKNKRKMVSLEVALWGIGRQYKSVLMVCSDNDNVDQSII